MNSVPDKPSAGVLTQQNEVDASNKPSKGLPPPRHGRPLGGWLRDVVISLAVSAFFIVFLYQPVKVEGTSMMPTLQDQERVFINKFVYKLEPIEAGDVIVFRYPRDPAKSYIKRVIAVAGDRVRIDAGVVYVNGHRLSEDYVPRMYEDVRSYPETIVRRTPISFLATTGISLTTAATSARSTKTSSTAKRCLGIGRWRS